jgi:predicted dehydrogenase
MPPIGVGIIGGSVGRSWAAVAHIPALRALPDFEIRALSTSRKESAEKAGRVFGVANAFDNHEALLACPGVDLVVVTVKVPTHLQLVTAALNAGKMVYCEWPLGNGLAEGETLAALARKRGLRTVTGLQVQGSPQVNHVRDLVADGYVGRVVSTSLIGSGGIWGATTDEGYAYLEDHANGATLMSIPMGHTLDGVCGVLGEFTSLSATAMIAWPEVKLAGSDRTVRRTTYDQIAVAGRIGDITASVHYRGGWTPGTNFLWEINGTEGVLQLTGGNGSLQAIAPVVRGARGGDVLAELPTPPAYRLVPAAVPDGEPLNVAQMYAMLAADLRDGSGKAPDFDHAVRRHRLLDGIEAAIETGERWLAT